MILVALGIGYQIAYALNIFTPVAGLKLLASTERTWKQTDADGNGIKDYWTLDVSCLHRLYHKNGTTKVNFIDFGLARADVNAYSRSNSSPFDLGNENNRDIEDWGSTPTLNTMFTITAKSGYYYQAMLMDENGVLYNQRSSLFYPVKTYRHIASFSLS
jgi:hypothetical protein